MTRRAQTSTDLLNGTREQQAIRAGRVAEDRKAERAQILRAAWIHEQMSTEQGQAFFHQVVFARPVTGVGVCGLNDCNPNVNVYQEGIRGLQASINDELKAHADPSDYAAMIMRPLGGKPLAEVAEQERKQA